MPDPASPTPPADEITVAVRYLRHFPDALRYGATMIRPTGETLFIEAATVRAGSPAEFAQ